MTAPDAAATFRRTGATPRTRRRRLGPAPGATSPNAATDGAWLNPLRPLPSCTAARPRDAGRRMRSAPERRATTRPARLPKPSVAGPAWGASRKRNCPTVRPRFEVTVARAWWKYDRREIAFTRVARRPTPKVWGLFRPGSSARQTRQSIQSKLAGLPRLTWRAGRLAPAACRPGRGWALERRSSCVVRGSFRGVVRT